MSDFPDIEFQGKSQRWYCFSILKVGSCFTKHGGIFVFAQKDDSPFYKLENFNFLHIGFDNKPLSYIGDLSEYFPQATHTLVCLDDLDRSFVVNDILKTTPFHDYKLP